MAGLTDDKAALIQMNHAMQKVTEQMERLAIGAGMAGHAIQKDFTEQIAHLHWVSSAIFDTMPFDGGRRHGYGGGFAGGRYFGDMEGDVLGGGSPRRPRPPRRPRQPFGGPGSPSQAMADRTTDSEHVPPGMAHRPLLAYRPSAPPSQAMPDRTTDTGTGRRRRGYDADIEAYTGEPRPRSPFTGYGRPGGTVLENDFNPLRRRFHDGLTKFFKNLWPQLPSLKLGTQLDRLTVGFKKLEDNLPPLAEFAHSAVKAGTMYGGVALQSSSPDAFATLTGSFKLLAATMGTELVPLAAHASRSLQNAAHSFERMDPGLKKFYTNLFLVGTATAGVIAALPRIIQLFKGLTTAAALGLEALKGAIGFAAAHPRLAGAGLAVGTATAAGAYFTHQVYNQNEQLRTYAEANKRSQEERTPEKIRQSTFYQRMLELPEGERDAFLRQEEHNADEMFKHRRNQLGEMLESPGFTGGVKKWANRFFQDEEIRGLQRGMAQHEGDRDMIRDIIKLRQGKFQMSPEAQKARDSARMSANSMLLDFQSRVQPAYYGIEDMGKKIQLEALGTSPLQEEIRRIQIQQLDVLLQIAGYSKEQASELKRNAGLP